MAITIEKNQGIRLRLAAATPTQLHQAREAGGYYKVRSYHGGGEFFEQENAQVILQCLGEFLPRATERPISGGGMEVFYQHLVNGQDTCSKSASLDSGIEVPATELARLEAAIAKLKAKEADPTTDPTKKEMIRAFRLPSPKKDPELYRLYGNGNSRRLLVLWGVEKEAGSSLSPQLALTEVPQAKRSVPMWIWLLLALLLLGIVIWLWDSQRSVNARANPDFGDSASSSPPPTASSPPQSVGGSMPRSEASPGSSPVNNGISAGGNPTQSLSSETLTSQPTSTRAGGNSGIAADKSSLSKDVGPLVPPTSGGSPPTSIPAPTDGTSPIKSGSSTQLPGVMPQGTAVNPNPTPQSPNSSKGDATTSNLSRNTPISHPDAASLAGSASPTAGKEASGAPAAAGSPTITTKRSTTLPDDRPNHPDSALPPPMAGTANNPPSTVPGGKSQTAPLSSVPGNSPPDPSITSPAMLAGKTPPPYTAEIVNARTTTTPRDGKVEMQLSLLARDGNGNAITIAKVNGWSVDGKPQTDPAGQPVISNALPVNLTEGKHDVRVSGVAADGRAVSAQAELSVGIAVREESSVRVKQLGKPNSP